MASPSEQAGPAAEQPRSLTKFIRRASKVLRPKSVVVPPEAIEDPMVISPITSPAPQSIPRAAPLASNPPTDMISLTTPAIDAAPSLNTTLAVDPKPTEIPHDAVQSLQAYRLQQQQKAQALFAKYGLNMETREPSPAINSSRQETQWVEIKVRMRSHRECHHCRTSFGTSKVCVNCSHVRCKTCPRWPAKQGASQTQIAGAPRQMAKNVSDDSHAAVLPTSDRRDPIGVAQEQDSMINDAQVEQEKMLDVQNSADAAPIFVAIDPTEQNEQLRMKQLGKVHQRRGADVVYRTPQYRVRRLCHRCDTVFKGRATECESCGHQRCPSCPRDPTKFGKFPEGAGYPGDVPEPEPTYPALERVWRKPRIRVRWTCHQCNNVFSSSNDRFCKGCKHSRCELCIREPTKKQFRQHPEEVLRGLEGKLDGLKLLPGGGAEAINVESADSHGYES